MIIIKFLNGDVNKSEQHFSETVLSIWIFSLSVIFNVGFLKAVDATLTSDCVYLPNYVCIFFEYL